MSNINNEKLNFSDLERVVGGAMWTCLLQEGDLAIPLVLTDEDLSVGVEWYVRDVVISVATTLISATDQEHVRDRVHLLKQALKDVRTAEDLQCWIQERRAARLVADAYEPIPMQAVQRYVREVKLVSDLAPNSEMNLALILLEKWGMALADNDGEDSAGRAKYKIMDPKKVVARAFTMAELAFREGKKRGWLVSTQIVGEDEEGGA